MNRLSRDERILIDNYMEHANQSRQQISSMLNYLSSVEAQMSRLLPYSTYNRTNRLSLNTPSISRNLLSNQPPEHNRPRRYTYASNQTESTSLPSTNFADLVSTVRRLNALNGAFGDPVIVRPSASQIIAATEPFTYSASNDLVNTSCPITQNNFEDGESLLRIRHCGHVFNNAALVEWFNRSVRCPVCRFDIRDHSTDRTMQNEVSSNTRVPEESETTTTESTDSLNENYNVDTVGGTITITSTSPSFFSDITSTDLSVNPLMQMLSRFQGQDGSGILI